MSFGLVPISVTLDDFERRNRPNRSVISQNSIHRKNWLKIHQYFLLQKYRPKNLVIAIYNLWRYWQGITPSESVKMRHCPLASENLTNNQR